MELTFQRSGWNRLVTAIGIHAITATDADHGLFHSRVCSTLNASTERLAGCGLPPGISFG